MQTERWRGNASYHDNIKEGCKFKISWNSYKNDSTSVGGNTWWVLRKRALVISTLWQDYRRSRWHRAGEKTPRGWKPHFSERLQTHWSETTKRDTALIIESVRPYRCCKESRTAPWTLLWGNPSPAQWWPCRAWSSVPAVVLPCHMKDPQRR